MEANRSQMVPLYVLWRTMRWRDRGFAAPSIKIKSEQTNAKRRFKVGQMGFKIEPKVMQQLIKEPYKEQEGTKIRNVGKSASLKRKNRVLRGSYSIF